MRYLSIFISIFSLAACSGSDVKDTLGLKRSAPDEFRVVTRPPLSVPPQFDLRPPASPGEVINPSAPDYQAKSLILGTPAGSDNTFRLRQENVPDLPSQGAAPVPSTPENNFLSRAGATELNPNIRSLIEEDKRTAAHTIEEEDSWWDVLSVLPGKKDPLVDAKAESERIQKNKEAGQPVTEGNTPEVKQRDTGILGRIFGY
jgi:hypothetical protein